METDSMNWMTEINHKSFYTLMPAFKKIKLPFFNLNSRANFCCLPSVSRGLSCFYVFESITVVSVHTSTPSLLTIPTHILSLFLSNMFTIVMRVVWTHMNASIDLLRVWGCISPADDRPCVFMCPRVWLTTSDLNWLSCHVFDVNRVNHIHNLFSPWLLITNALLLTSVRITEAFGWVTNPIWVH